MIFSALRNFLARCALEKTYAKMRPWSLRETGRFWDTVSRYDGINEKIYTYYGRFTDSYKFSEMYLFKNDYTMLDIQTRSGNGALFWHEKKKIKRAACADFSDNMLSMTDNRLKDSGLEYSCVKVEEFPVPFAEGEFDLVCSYETVEHVCDAEMFISELSRVLRKDGILVLTCPNTMWEWAHWLAAVFNIAHSEGPHRFLPRKELLDMFDRSGLKVLSENTTKFLPFNNRVSIKIDSFLEKIVPEPVKRHLFLRRIFVLKKRA